MAGKSVEQLQQEVLETQLETAKIALEKTRDENADYRQRKQVAKTANEGRQREFANAQRNLRRIQEVCQHMAGGDADQSPLEGGGKFSFSVLHVTIMPDGVTELIQCPRCRLTLYGRHRPAREENKMRLAAEAAEKKNPENFQSDKAWRAWEDHQWWKRLRDLFKREGLGRKSISRGPTFAFTDAQGAPHIPDITGYATSGAGGR